MTHDICAPVCDSSRHEVGKERAHFVFGHGEGLGIGLERVEWTNETIGRADPNSPAGWVTRQTTEQLLTV